MSDPFPLYFCCARIDQSAVEKDRVDLFAVCPVLSLLGLPFSTQSHVFQSGDFRSVPRNILSHLSNLSLLFLIMVLGTFPAFLVFGVEHFIVAESLLNQSRLLNRYRLGQRCVHLPC
jgi:hypothetical protein